MLSSSLIAQRKEKRMLSNRESARRSRMRKHKYLNDLMLQLSCLRHQKDEIFTAINLTSHRHIRLEAQNCLLRAQLMDLIKRLHCLRHILHCMNVAGAGDDVASAGFASSLPDAQDDTLLRPWTSLHIKQGLQGSDVF